MTVQPNLDEPHGDYLSTVDVDPESPTYCQVIHRTFTHRQGQELHHSGWNACSSCYKVEESCKNVPCRDKLILPCLNTNTIFVADVSKDPRAPEFTKVIDGQELLDKNVCAPHTTHCLADGNIMISTMGDKNGDSKGDFFLLNSNFETVGTWTNGETAVCGYDFWYQPYFNVMIASEWSAPNMFKRSFYPSDINDEHGYGRHLNVYNWKERKLVQKIDLGIDGIFPLEIRFLHSPKKNEGFVGCCFKSNVFRFFKPDGSDEYKAEKVIDVPAKEIEGWTQKHLEGMMSDILISMDDKFLYFSNWLHGDVRQYDITDTKNPKLTGQVFIGGVICKDGVKVTKDLELDYQPKPTFIHDRRLFGGPQMLQLSLDGKRLYVSSSFYSPFDKKYYPEMVEHGGFIIQIDCDVLDGGMKLNNNFLVDFGKEPYGPTLAHEMRYPGGDCTSDIFLADD